MNKIIAYEIYPIHRIPVKFELPYIQFRCKLLTDERGAVRIFDGADAPLMYDAIRRTQKPCAAFILLGAACS